MIKLLILGFFLVTGSPLFSQKDTIRKYLDADLHFTSKKDAVYPAMLIKNEDHWVLYAVYPDTSLLLKVYFKDATLTKKDGPFMLYHRKGVPAQSGYFKD